jgi:hypothetical protein
VQELEAWKASGPPLSTLTVLHLFTLNEQFLLLLDQRIQGLLQNGLRGMGPTVFPESQSPALAMFGASSHANLSSMVNAPAIATRPGFNAGASAFQTSSPAGASPTPAVTVSSLIQMAVGHAGPAAGNPQGQPAASKQKGEAQKEKQAAKKKRAESTPKSQSAAKQDASKFVVGEFVAFAIDAADFTSKPKPKAIKGIDCYYLAKITQLQVHGDSNKVMVQWWDTAPGAATKSVPKHTLKYYVAQDQNKVEFPQEMQDIATSLMATSFPLTEQDHVPPDWAQALMERCKEEHEGSDGQQAQKKHRQGGK